MTNIIWGIFVESNFPHTLEDIDRPRRWIVFWWRGWHRNSFETSCTHLERKLSRRTFSLSVYVFSGVNLHSNLWKFDIGKCPCKYSGVQPHSWKTCFAKHSEVQCPTVYSLKNARWWLFWLIQTEYGLPSFCSWICRKATIGVWPAGIEIDRVLSETRQKSPIWSYQESFLLQKHKIKSSLGSIGDGQRMHRVVHTQQPKTSFPKLVHSSSDHDRSNHLVQGRVWLSLHEIVKLSARLMP